MPELSRFYGIVIRMYFADHNPPHFHAFYGGDEALIDVRTLTAFGGGLPPRALGLVIEWASMHRGELIECWRHAQALEPIDRIDPLP